MDGGRATGSVIGGTSLFHRRRVARDERNSPALGGIVATSIQHRRVKVIMQAFVGRQELSADQHEPETQARITTRISGMARPGQSSLAAAKECGHPEFWKHRNPIPTGRMRFMCCPKSRKGAARSRTEDGGFAIRCLSHLATAPTRGES